MKKVTHVQRFRGGIVFKAHRLLYHSTLGLRVIKKKTKVTYVKRLRKMTYVKELTYVKKLRKKGDLREKVEEDLGHEKGLDAHVDPHQRAPFLLLT